MNGVIAFGAQKAFLWEDSDNAMVFLLLPKCVAA